MFEDANFLAGADAAGSQDSQTAEVGVSPASLSLHCYGLSCKENEESRGSVKYISFHICVQKILYSSASGEMAAQVQTFRKVFAGFVLIQWVLSGSGICENYVEDDS